MPISPVIAATVEVRLLWVIGGAGAINVLHGIVGAGLVVNQALANTVGAAIKATVASSNLATAMPPSTSLVRVGLRDLRAPNLPEFLDTSGVASGSTAGDVLPGNVAQCITLRTAGAGKSFRGRVYIGGWLEAANDANGNQAAANATGGVAFITAIQGAMAASSITLAVASRPAEAYTINKTTFHQDGTTTVKQVGRGNARAGGSSAVTLIQSRTNSWESQRRRNNLRGSVPTLFDASRTVEITPGEPGRLPRFASSKSG